MSIKLSTPSERLKMLAQVAASLPSNGHYTLQCADLRNLVLDANAAVQLHFLINNPHTADFLHAVELEAAHQRDRWGEAHDRGKSAENWFWLVGYLAGKCLRAVIDGDKEKALHHTISTGAACANWYEAIKRDETGTGLGHDRDIMPRELARFENGSSSLETSDAEAVQLTRLPVLVPDQYSGR